MIHLQLGFLQIGDVVEHTVEQRKPPLFAQPFYQGPDPYDVAVPVQLAKLKGGELMGLEDHPGLSDHHGGILPVNQLRGIPLDELGVFRRSMAGQGWNAVGKVHGLEAVRGPVDHHAARNGVDDVLELFAGARQLRLQVHRWADVAVYAVQKLTAIRLGLDRAVQADPAVLLPAVIPEPVGMLEDGIPLPEGVLHDPIEGGPIFRVNAQHADPVLQRLDLLLTAADDLIKSRVAEHRDKPGAVGPVDAQTAGDIAEDSPKLGLKGLGLLLLPLRLRHVQNVFDVSAPAGPVDQFAAELIQTLCVWVAEAAHRQLRVAQTVGLAEGAGGVKACGLITGDPLKGTLVRKKPLCQRIGIQQLPAVRRADADRHGRVVQYGGQLTGGGGRRDALLRHSLRTSAFTALLRAYDPSEPD